MTPPIPPSRAGEHTCELPRGSPHPLPLQVTSEKPRTHQPATGLCPGGGFPREEARPGRAGGGPPGRRGAGAGPPRSAGRTLAPRASGGRTCFGIPRLQHGARAANARAVLRCPVPLLLDGLRGDAWEQLARGLGRRRQREGSAKTRGPRSREFPGSPLRGLGQEGREPGLKVTLLINGV